MYQLGASCELGAKEQARAHDRTDTPAHNWHSLLAIGGMRPLRERITGNLCGLGFASSRQALAARLPVISLR